MTDEKSDTTNLTMDQKLDRIQAEMADQKSWRTEVDALLEDRAQETLLKLELIIKDLSDMRKETKDAALRLGRIEFQLETLAMSVVAVRQGLEPRLDERIGEIEPEMARDNEVAVMSKDAEITTQAAADYLKVSLAYLVKVIDSGELPSRLVGNHHRVKVKDVLVYEQSLNEKKRGRVVPPPVKMRDMSKDMRWLAEHRDEYAGKWVAVYEDRLVASGDSAKDVYEASDKIGLPQTLVTFIEAPLLRRKG